MDSLRSLLRALTTWQTTIEWSSVVIALVTAFAGAFAGALGAQRIAERSKARDDLLKEIRNTNAAIMVAFSICNSLLANKKQHLKSLKETYNTQKADFLAHREKVKRHETTEIYYFPMDLKALSLPPLPVDILQHQIFEKLSVLGRSLALATTLRQTIHGLGASLEARNQFIENSKTPHDEVHSIALYFGLPYGGRVNEEYSAYVEAIYAQNDDGIYFSKLLCEDLMAYGKTLATTFKKRFGKGAPAINEPVWTNAGDLMPPDKDYADWLSMFVKIPMPTKRNGLAIWKNIRTKFPYV